MRGRRWLVYGGAALVGATVRLWLASTTFGTNDVHYWMEFAAGIRRDGPLGVYEQSGFTAQYNHPPLIGYYLALVGRADLDSNLFRLLVRLPSCLADLAASWMLFQLVRVRSSERAAIVTAVALTLSPVAIIVSGFHGNTDPVFISLLLGALRAVDRRRDATAGFCLALSISIKIVPVIALPALFIAAGRHGFKAAMQFVSAGVAIFVVVWMPALVTHGEAVVDKVIAYRGIPLAEWGVPELLRVLGADSAASTYINYAGVPIALISSAVAAFIAVRGDHARAVCLGVVLFLVLSPAFAMQYLVWPLALGLLLHRRLGAAYAATSSVLALVVYSHWSGAWPGAWYEAHATPFLYVDIPLMFMTWLCLVAVLIESARVLVVARRPLHDCSGSTHSR